MWNKSKMTKIFMRMNFFINLKTNDNIHNEHFFSLFSNRKRHENDIIVFSRKVSFFSKFSFQIWFENFQFLNYFVTKYIQLKIIIETRKISINELKTRHFRFEIWNDKTTNEKWIRKKKKKSIFDHKYANWMIDEKTKILNFEYWKTIFIVLKMQQIIKQSWKKICVIIFWNKCQTIKRYCSNFFLIHEKIEFRTKKMTSENVDN